MTHLTDIVKSFINSKHGWAVADQFESTFSNPSEENFTEKNLSALSYIVDTVEDMVNSNILSENATEELQEYLDKLNNYLSEPVTDKDIVELERGWAK